MLVGHPIKRWGPRKPPLGAQILQGHDLAQGLVGAWLLNEGGGTAIFDVAGRNFTSSFVSGPAWATGPTGPVISLSGSNYIDIPNTAVFNQTGPFAFAFTMQLAAGDTTAWRIVLSKSGNQWYFQRNGSSNGDYFNVTGLSPADASTNSGGAFDGQWHQILCQYTGSNLEIWQDGGLAVRQAVTGTPSTTTNDVHLGEGGGNFWNGSIGQFLFYSRALGAAEIQQLYTEPFAFIAPPQPQRSYFLPQVSAATTPTTPNLDPIFTKIPDVSYNAGTGMNALITAAANDYTGAGANNSLVFTADATNGSYIQRLRFKAAGTNVATVARIFINNGSANTTASNNVFYGEVSLPATTATTTGANVDIDYLMNFALPAGFRIYVGLGTAVAAGWVVLPVAGRY